MVAGDRTGYFCCIAWLLLVKILSEPERHCVQINDVYELTRIPRLATLVREVMISGNHKTITTIVSDKKLCICARVKDSLECITLYVPPPSPLLQCCHVPVRGWQVIPLPFYAL